MQGLFLHKQKFIKNYNSSIVRMGGFYGIIWIPKTIYSGFSFKYSWCLSWEKNSSGRCDKSLHEGCRCQARH